MAARWALALFVVLTLCPIRYHAATVGLDPSWAVSMNQFHVSGLVFGRDVVFTYGPLSYLILPMPFGTNLEQGIAFQMASWLMFTATVFLLVARSRVHLLNLVIAALCAPAGTRIIHEFGFAGPDLFLEFLVIFWLACAVEVAPAFYYLACGLTVLLAFIKISTAIGALAALLLLPLLLALLRERNALRFAAAGYLGVPAAFAMTFRLYAGDWTAVGRYLRSALEMSAGNSAAMSLAGAAAPLEAALLMMTGFLLLAAAFLWTGEKRTAALVGAMLGPLFLEYKHSFTRQDSHEAIIFTFVPLLLIAVLLPRRLAFAMPNWRAPFPSAIIPAAIAVIVLPWIYFTGPGKYAHRPLFPFSTLARVLSFRELKQELLAASNAALATDRLPAELLARLGEHSVTIYPQETAYAAANPMHYRPLPVPQSFLAYTPYLDAWNADFLSGNTRPDFVLFGWSAIDDRHPLLDCPASFLAMYVNYELDSRFGPHLLLRKRSQPLAIRMVPVKQQQLRFGESFREPLAMRDASHILLARLPARPSIQGRALDFFFRLAPMHLTLSGPGGHVIGPRVPPAVLAAAFPLNITPMDLADAANLFAGKPMRESFNTAALSGPGRSAFEEPIDAVIFDTGLPSPGSASVPLPKAGALSASASIERMTFSFLNGEGVSNRSSRETIAVSGDRGYLSVDGWAILATPESSLFVAVDGRAFQTLPGGQLALGLFPQGTPVRSFHAKVPVGELSTGVHTLRLVETVASGDAPRIGDRTLTFQIGDH